MIAARITVAATLIGAAIAPTAGCRHDRTPPQQPTAATSHEDSPSPRTVEATPRAAAEQSPLHSLIGRTCRVQFRRDALGVAANAPLAPTAEGVGGRPAHVIGTVTAVTETWFALSHDDVTYHIPHAAILLIESRE